MGAIVMDHAVVGEHSIIAAGAVVIAGTEVEPGTIWAGVPARKVKNTSSEMIRGEIERIAGNYIRYAAWFKDIQNDKSPR
jgi:carbonic anhydrase/acetyltransferase-like protein (isoleucine patch superfamily)